MIELRRFNTAWVALAGLALSGCVAAVPVQPVLTVIPGQGKTEANLRADDAVCRTAPAATVTPGTAAAPAVQATESQYYACMASHGESVIQQQAQAYPAYAYPAYAATYPAYAAYPAYGYPYYGYPYGLGYGYPAYGGYFGPYVGFGIGFGYGRFYGGRGFYGGYHGFGGYGGFHGGYGGFHGGFHR